MSAIRARPSGAAEGMTLERGSILPAVRLTTAPTGTEATLRSGRGPRIVLVPHSPACEACMEWMRALASDGHAVDDWDARLSIVVIGSLEQATTVHASLPSGVRTFADPDQALGLAPGSVIVSDEWGEVYFAMSAGSGHEFPSAAEIAEWARFIAVQCPECEGPEGEWRTL